jgi:hypothetical protein
MINLLLVTRLSEDLARSALPGAPVRDLEPTGRRGPYRARYARPRLLPASP